MRRTWVRSCRRFVVAATLAAGAAAAQPATDEPYPVSVWGRVLFGTDGKPAEVALVDEAQYPSKFVAQVRERLARARIRPPEVDGRPATLRTGVEMRLTVVPQGDGGTVRVDSVSMSPLPVKRYLASYPSDIGRVAGWKGEADAVCTVGIDGRCAKIDVQAPAGMPDSVRRYMRASLEQWVFEPQQIDGRAVEGEYRFGARFATLDDSPENFRQDQFLRILRGR
jgi:hypothetical protein